MAPRGGRGGGSRGGSGSVASCSNDDAFSSDYSKVVIAFIALFFFVYSVLLWMLFRRKRDSKAGWVPLFLSMFLSWAATTMNLVVYPTSECGLVAVRDYEAISITTGWIGGIADLLLVATIMVPICKLVTGGSKIMTIVSSVFVGFLTILWLCTLAIGTRLALGDSYYYGYSEGLYYLAKAQNGLLMTRYVFMVLGVGFAGLIMVIQMLRKHELKKGKIAAMLSFLILFALAYTLLALANYINQSYFDGFRMASSLAVFFLFYFFYSGAVGCAMSVIVSPHLTADRKYPSHVPVASPAYAPYGPSYQYVPQSDRPVA